MKIPSPSLLVSFLLFLTILGFNACQRAHSTETDISKLVFSDSEQMQLQKGKYRSGDEKVVALVRQLREEADRLLTVGPFSVVHKEQIPPSGNKHDYMSQGPYWWPDTTKSDGLPYIRKDGQVNPERATLTDHRELGELIEASEHLSRAYFFTEDEQYAQRAAHLLDVWFVQDSSRMNPHLEYGQAIPGRTEGRGIGIIETRYLGKITDAITLIRTSKAWTPELDSGLQTWMSAYLDWLQNSKKGQDESVHPNNHGTWYDVQAATLALFTEQDSLAKIILEKAKASRFDDDLEANGAQPRELARTLSFNYSTMNLYGLFTLARLGEMVEVDLWHYQTPKGGNLKAALDYLLPAALGQNEWTHEQIKPIHPESLIPHLAIAARVYDPHYSEIARELMEAYPEQAKLSLYLPLESPESPYIHGLKLEDIGKNYTPNPAKVPDYLFFTNSNTGGTTSIRRIDSPNLVWKKQGYYQRNRELGQTFFVPAGSNIQLDAIVLRTGNSANAILPGAAGSEVQIQFFEVVGTPSINDNGTPPGTDALHGYTTNHRADDYLEGIRFRTIKVIRGGIFPTIAATTRQGDEAGHLRYIRWDLQEGAELVLEGGKRYAFLVGFTEDGPDKGFSLGNDNQAGSPAPPELRTDANGYAWWSIRREGDGTLPPTHHPGENPPTERALQEQLLKESLFEPGYELTLPPATNGFPDVDTYRTLEFYLEVR